MVDTNEPIPPKPKKSVWQIYNQILPRFSYKVIILLMTVGVISVIFRWIKWHI